MRLSVLVFVLGTGCMIAAGYLISPPFGLFMTGMVLVFAAVGMKKNGD